MKKIILTLISVLMLCGMFSTTSMAATSTGGNVIQAKGYANQVGIEITYDSSTLTLKAVSSGKAIHPGYYNGTYLTFSYYNADDTLRYKEIVPGNQTCTKLANAINSQPTVFPGDYIKIEHAEQYTRLSINGSVENINIDLSNGTKTLNLGVGIFYLGYPNMEYTTKFTSDMLKQLNTILAAAKQLKKEDYRYDTWQVLQNEISLGDAVATTYFVTQSNIQTAINRITAAQNNLKVPNAIHLLGSWNHESLNLSIDYQTMRLRAIGSSKIVHDGFFETEYYNVTIKDAVGKVLFSQGVNGVESSSKIAAALNGFQMAEGYSLYIGHKESADRMWVSGPIVNAPYDLSSGMKVTTYGTDIHFQLVKGDLVYRAN